MRTRWITTVAMAAGSIVLATGGTATAGADSQLSTTDGATARFLHYGDDIRVCDTQADGESVYAQYYINGGSTQSTSQHNGGVNSCAKKGIGDIREGAEVTIRAARQAELAPDNYGAWKTGIA